MQSLFSYIGEHRREIGLLAVLYLAFAIFYMVSLKHSLPAEYNADYSWGIIYLDYPLKALFTLPIWYLTFRVFDHWSLRAKILLNIALMPVWVKGWQQTYYWIYENVLDRWHLEGSGQWWDIYIPGLFYAVQFGVFHAWHYYQNFRTTELARAESERLALQSELSALKAQLNPHFLYNAFNTISASVGPGQEQTRQMIAQLSDLFRYQLAANRSSRVTLAEEFDFVADYLRLEHARFGDRLTFRIAPTADDPLCRASIPPLLLQPLVENAVRHGISPKVEGGEVVVEAKKVNDHLRLMVSDNGVGFPPEERNKPREGYGLRNTRRRLRLLFDQELIIEQPADGGTRCIFYMPLEYAQESTADRRRSSRPEPVTGVSGRS
ncbi:sensor histidine kinase [Lewinella sp. W8]|uniref:sensor histidine kinase n=1 Tax=Lewinella sp. W8 TaxID=2528208 RepID=UPI001068C775|nr:histidine kinase [Lewinella sp. W8]MTB52226.1 sensor histidine kinase [Lewinella sp. W8]